MYKEAKELPSQNDDASYYAIIPGPVLNSEEIPDGAKILYGVISTLTKKEGYCYARNETLAARVKKEADTVSKLVSKLDKAGFVHVEVIRDPNTRAVLERRIYPVMDLALMSWKKSMEAPGNKSDTPPGKKSDTPPGKKSEKSNKDSSIPPIVPQGGRRRRTAKEKPDHKPERFSAFWEFYRNNARGENKQAAMKAWDRLKPSDELIDTMAKALNKQVKSKSWQEGIGIPYASTWLNNRRWEDEIKAPVVSNSSKRGWAEDREVL